jgi:hypothetical protein
MNQNKTKRQRLTSPASIDFKVAKHGKHEESRFNHLIVQILLVLQRERMLRLLLPELCKLPRDCRNLVFCIQC